MTQRIVINRADINKYGIREEVLKPVAVAARDGHLIIFPTDTVYGLGSNALLPDAARNIFKVKERPADKPLILLIADPGDFSKYVTQRDGIAKKLMELYWPGPLTLILKKSDIVPDEVTVGGDTVGIRCPDDEIARKIIRLAGVALATTSANITSRPSPKLNREVESELIDKVSYFVDSDRDLLGIESTVVDLSWGEPALVREGAISWRKIVSSLT